MFVCYYSVIISIMSVRAGVSEETGGRGLRILPFNWDE